MATVSPVSGRSLVLMGFAIVIPVGADAEVARADVVSHGVDDPVFAGVATTAGKARVVTTSVRADTTVAGMMFVRGMCGVVVAGTGVSARASVSD
jgi:hypothetical protein